MTTRTCSIAIAALLVSTVLHSQSREWTTSGYDAQRTSWLRADERLTKNAMQKGDFQFLWKLPFENTNRHLNSLTTPVLLDRLIGYRGFKTLAFVGGSDDRIFSVDADLARPYWTTALTYSAATGGHPPASAECPGGLVAAPSRRTQLAPVPAASGGGRGRGGVRNGSAVGEPGKGAAVLAQRPPQRGAAPGGRGQPGRGGREGPSGGLAGRGGGFGGVEPIFAVGSDGFLHALYVSNGADIEPAVPFVPPDAKPSALIVIDGVVYTTTSEGCGGTPNAVWAMDVSVPAAERKTRSWKTGGASIAGASGLAFGADGTIFVALTKTAVARPRAVPPGGARDMPLADAIVALDPATLEPTDWFTAPGADFTSTPIVVELPDRELVAASSGDGRLFLLDAKSLGGGDHRTPLAASGRFTAEPARTDLATYEELGVRYIVATASGASDVTFTLNGLAPNGRIVAFRIAQDAGKVSLAPAWQSRDLTSPLAPIVVNGMVLAVSSGEYRGTASLTPAQRARRSLPAVLYVLDAATGKTLWSSGTKITSFARAGLSAGGGQVYLVTYDNHLYAFGIPMEH